ncbi:hypothetical protein F2A37_03995, partial [Pseudomonas chlororaphis]
SLDESFYMKPDAGMFLGSPANAASLLSCGKAMPGCQKNGREKQLVDALETAPDRAIRIASSG